MSSRADITAKYAMAYKAASKKDRGRLLDEVVAVTGWSRDNARRRLAAAAKAPSPGKGRQVAAVARRRRANKYSYDALKVLHRVWAASGGQCGKYLVESMPLLLDSLEARGELIEDTDRYSQAVREELLAMSAATIDRYLKGARDGDKIRGIATTKASPVLRSSITIRKAGDEVEAEPGFFEGDTVAHCGPTLKGEFARTVNLTCVHTGWVFTRAIRNNAHLHVLGVLKAAVDEISFEVVGLDFDNGGEFLNHEVIKWAGERQIYFTRSRPYKKNDQATIESKNNHLVRKNGFYYRYDTPAELAGTEPALAPGQRPAQLLHPNQEANRLGRRPKRSTAKDLRQARHAVGSAAGGRGALACPGRRADRPPRQPQPCRPGPQDPRRAADADQARQGQDRPAPRSNQTGDQEAARHRPQHPATRAQLSPLSLAGIP